MNWTWNFTLSSPLDILEAAHAPLEPYAMRNAERHRPATEFCGNVTYAEAATLASTGWPDGPNLADLAEQIAPTETRQSHEMQHAVSGSFVDIGRFVEGHPECMLEFAEEPASKQIALSVNLCKASEETPRQLELAGAVALAAIDTLARSCFAVDLYAHAALESKEPQGRHAITKFPLARAGEPIDPDQLAFWLCHPAALRSLIFGYWDTCPADFYLQTRQDSSRGSVWKPSAQSVGVDYIVTCSPRDERQAAAEYHRIIAEIQNTL